jgi:hypothetical protein
MHHISNGSLPVNTVNCRGLARRGRDERVRLAADARLGLAQLASLTTSQVCVIFNVPRNRVADEIRRRAADGNGSNGNGNGNGHAVSETSNTPNRPAMAAWLVDGLGLDGAVNLLVEMADRSNR